MARGVCVVGGGGGALLLAPVQVNDSTHTHTWLPVYYHLYIPVNTVI